MGCHFIMFVDFLFLKFVCARASVLRCLFLDGLLCYVMQDIVLHGKISPRNVDLGPVCTSSDM